MRRWRWTWTLSLAGLIFTTTLAGVGFWIASSGPGPRGENLDFSTLVLDREGRLLRAYTTQEGRWRLPTTVKDVDPRFIDLLLAYEDKRFRQHIGIDPLALLRAAYLFVKERRIVSGGSTLTMQVARLLEPRRERSLANKLREMFRAMALERNLSKDEIINLYLTLAPYGGNLEGIRAASLTYFGKEPRRLALHEAALLVALPQSPELRRPDRSAAAAKRARDRVLDRVATAGRLPADEVALAQAEPAPNGRKPMPVLAPHAADAAVAAAPERRIHCLTIDAIVQRRLQELARERARALGPDLSVAIIAADHATGEVLARVASADYFDERRAGHVDMTQALRSPGSALKPFIYGLGFEDGLIHPETLLEDRPVRYGSYAPENFDLTFQGTVTVRRALQLSLNVPAVNVLERVGASRLSARLSQAGAALVLPKGEAPGLAMALGGVGITLTHLTELYAAVARGGDPARFFERTDRSETLGPRRLLEPSAAWYLGDILLGTPPPENAAGGRIAYKTGTSYGYRDAWSVGFDGKRTIGVWVGRPDGAPVPGLVGRMTAAPILFDAFSRLGLRTAPLPPAPKGTLLAAASKLPPPLQRLRAGYTSDPAALRIMFPPDGAQLELASRSGEDAVPVKIAGGVAPLTLLINGMPASAKPGSRALAFQPDGPGFVRLTVLDAAGATDSVLIRLQQ
jgi:penicillin-binding protein 1C